ncbi:MAG: phosphohydrolase [Bacillota bacterium]|nr:phosphohydrolase [Bacillota bacterium]
MEEKEKMKQESKTEINSPKETSDENGLHLEPIRTYTNVVMYPLNPRKEDFRISDIAHALSLMTRANGHFTTFYSVAQHCLNCSYEAEARGYSRRMQLALLLHDASEAYLSDLTRPVKAGITQYREIENHLNDILFEAFGIFNFEKEEKKMLREIDDDMMYYEFENLHISGGFHKEYHLRKEHPLAFRDMAEVEDEYIRRFQALTISR